MICPNCKGKGYSTHTFEAETSNLPCKACDAKGKVSDTKFFLQNYEEQGADHHWSTSIYHGPCLDYRVGFHNLRIVINEFPSHPREGEA
jgi:RecJ-like exonuclease